MAHTIQNILKPVCVYLCVPLLLLCLLLSKVEAKKYNDADSIKVNSLIVAAFYKTETDPKGSIQISEQALALAKKTEFQDGIESALLNIGYVYIMTGDVKKAFLYCNNALNLSRQNKSIGAEAMALDKIGIIYNNIGMLDSAFACHVQALKLLQMVKHDYGYIAIEYSNIGIDLIHQKSYEEANKNLLKAIERYHIAKKSSNEAFCLGYVASNYTKLKKYTLAYSYFMQSLKLVKLGITYSSLGDYYNDIEKYDSALYNYQIALHMLEEDSSRQEIAETMQSMAGVFEKKGDLKQAEEYFKHALAIGRELSSLETITNIEADIATFYAQQQNYKEAYLYHIESAKYKDSLLSKEKVDKLAQLSVVYEVKESEQKNESLQKENAFQRLRLQRNNFFIYGTLSALALLLIIGALLIRQNKLNANQQKTELEQKQLRAQMNPHFIFNCLNSIQHFVLANDVKNANKYLSGFASLMRQTLENSKEGVITLRKELAYLENYVELEQMRFEDKFTYDIHCANDIDPDSIEIPAMIIQPFVENSIRHGLCYLKNKKGQLKINFYKKDG